MVTQSVKPCVGRMQSNLRTRYDEPVGSRVRPQSDHSVVPNGSRVRPEPKVSGPLSRPDFLRPCRREPAHPECCSERITTPSHGPHSLLAAALLPFLHRRRYVLRLPFLRCSRTGVEVHKAFERSSTGLLAAPCAACPYQFLRSTSGGLRQENSCGSHQRQSKLQLLPCNWPNRAASISRPSHCVCLAWLGPRSWKLSSTWQETHTELSTRHSSMARFGFCVHFKRSPQWGSRHQWLKSN